MSTAHPQSLGAFVRAHRERTSPAQVGLPAGLRRRAPGLKREELAALAGISTTWLTWIEQGRAPTVSAPALARLADALSMTAAERAYLFRLAALHDPAEAGDAAAPVPDAATELLAAAVRQMRAPAYVLDPGWDAIAWNPPAARLFVGWLDRAARERNLLRYMFLDPRARALVDGWPERAARLVAEFRADGGPSLDLPGPRGAVDTLRAQSPEFAALWKQQGVLEREGGERRFNHPSEGRIVRRQITLRVAASPQLKLVMLV